MFKTFITISVVMIFALSGVCQLADEAKSDEDAYYGMAQVQGIVTILNHPTLGRTRDVGDVVVFQRRDCHACVVSTRTDIHGHYEVFLSKGEYKLIMRTGTRAGETRDVLAPSQTRYIEVTKNGEVKVFDIEIVLSRD